MRAWPMEAGQRDSAAKDEEEERKSDIARLSQWERQIALAPAP